MSYPPNQGSRPTGAPAPTPDKYPQLRQILHTQEGFRRSISFSGTTDSALIVVLGLAVIMFALNIYSTIQTIRKHHYAHDFSTFWSAFISTVDGNNHQDPTLWAMVYIPLIAIPVLIVILIVRHFTRDRSIQRVYEQFNQGGFIAQFLTTNVSIKVANSVAPLFVVGASTLPADWLPAAAAQIHRLATNDPKSPETKAYIAALTGTATDIGTLFPVGAADPSLPAGIFLTPLSATEVPPQIAVPARTQGCFKLYRLKKDVSIA